MMKKELSTGAMAGIAGIAIVVIGGLGYMWYSKSTSDAPMDVNREKMEAAAAKARYDGFKTGSSAPGGAGSNAEADARAKMGSGGTTPPAGNN